MLSCDSHPAVDFVVCMHFHANTSYAFFFAAVEIRTVFGIMTPFILAGEYKRFEGTKCLCLQNKTTTASNMFFQTVDIACHLHVFINPRTAI
jgi:hypothetical protein